MTNVKVVSLVRFLNIAICNSIAGNSAINTTNSMKAIIIEVNEKNWPFLVSVFIFLYFTINAKATMTTIDNTINNGTNKSNSLVVELCI